MSLLSDLVLFGIFLLVIIPSGVLAVGAWRLDLQDETPMPRRTLILLLAAAVVSTGLLGLLIWFNPYGRTISSSFAAFGVLPVLVALWVLVIRKAREIVRLWSTDRSLLVVLGLVGLGLFAFLWLAEPITFYIVIILTLALSLGWVAVTRSGTVLVTILSLFSVVWIFYTSGAVFFLLGMDNPSWVETLYQVVTVATLLVAIFIPAALLYNSLKGEGTLDWRKNGWQIILAALLILASAYPVFWDGIWSSAHARAYEDHLPFNQFLLSLLAGLLLAISLRGRRRLVGLAFVASVTLIATLALTWGWSLNAFDLTRSRASRVEQALIRYHQEQGAYPSTLHDLTPRYLLFVPPPLVVRRVGWCYQGGADFYRLGYVSGDFTYMNAYFKVEVFSQAGEPPQEGWSCDAMAQKFQAGNIGY